jgi:NAD-dependent deacetylase
MAQYCSIVILTGAGISAESGIHTFRGSDGLWEDHAIEDVASPEGWQRDPALVQRFYNERRRRLLEPQVQPNAAHRALARLEQAFQGTYLLVTQNIDDLHERAGSHSLVHMHGELLKVRCEQCGALYPTQRDVELTDCCLRCAADAASAPLVGSRRPARLRPHVVWFGEEPLGLSRIAQALNRCDCFIAIGTSGNVYPAAGFVQQAYFSGAHTIELNLEPSVTHTLFAERRYGLATALVPTLVDELLRGDS